MLVWKFFLAISTIGLLVGTAALGAGATFNTLAATHAMIGAVSLFVALLRHTGRINDALDLVLSITVGYAALLAGWFWLDLPNNDIGNLIYIVGGALFILLAVALTPIARLILSLFSRDEN